MRHLELFAGIGGFRLALTKLSKDFNIQQNTVGFSEIDREATRTYKANYDTSNEVEMGDIVSFNSNNDNIKKLPDFDLLTGGFPCQSFSMMGKQLGFSDSRGNLFFEIIKILEIKKPKFVLLENVRNLKSHNKGETYQHIESLLKQTGYHVYNDVFNTSDFGLAQTRNRIYIFATTESLPNNFAFSSKQVQEVFKTVFKDTSLLKQQSTHDVLDKQTDAKYYLSERIKPTILADGSGNYKARSTINPLIAKPLTATMVKMHRACQDNYFCDDYILSKNPQEYAQTSFSKEEQLKMNIRKLTPWEALALQGFDRLFYENASKNDISNHQLYKQAGNAVSVNTVYAILYYLFVYNKLGSF